MIDTKLERYRKSPRLRRTKNHHGVIALHTLAGNSSDHSQRTDGLTGQPRHPRYRRGFNPHSRMGIIIPMAGIVPRFRGVCCTRMMRGRLRGRLAIVVRTLTHDLGILFSSRPTDESLRDALPKAVKAKLKSLRQPFNAVFHAVKSELNGQIADYFARSLFRREEHQGREPLKALSPLPADSFNLFQKGCKKYYLVRPPRLVSPKRRGFYRRGGTFGITHPDHQARAHLVWL